MTHPLATHRDALEQFVVAPGFETFVRDTVNAGLLHDDTDAGALKQEWADLWRGPASESVRGDALDDAEQQRLADVAAAFEDRP